MKKPTLIHFLLTGFLASDTLFTGKDLFNIFPPLESLTEDPSFLADFPESATAKEMTNTALSHRIHSPCLRSLQQGLAFIAAAVASDPMVIRVSHLG